MTYKTKFVDGELTIGEARAMVGIATGAPEASNVEAYVIISFNHLGPDNHEFVIVSDRGKKRREIDTILYLAHRATMAQILDSGQASGSNGGWLRDTWIRYQRFAYLWKASRMG